MRCSTEAARVYKLKRFLFAHLLFNQQPKSGNQLALPNRNADMFTRLGWWMWQVFQLVSSAIQLYKLIRYML